ncbi:MAG: HNH endonuclease signature motif containing protein [Nitrospirota bacterium]
MENLHKEFVRLGRERNRITYKLLALLPKINEQKIYEKEGYANIYDYATKIAGLGPEVVKKTLKFTEKLQDMPHLQKAIETQGIHKVAIVTGLATKENEKELAEKVENMSKPALQEYSKEARGKVTISWQVELDEEMMFMFLKLKKKLGKNLSNKECLRKILEEMQEKSEPQVQPQRQARKQAKIPGEKLEAPGQLQKVTRYISVHRKRELSERCSHPGCHRPAEIIHHPDRFSQNRSHENLQPLCKQHHEFAHNGIFEPMRSADYKYRIYRREALV